MKWTEKTIGHYLAKHTFAANCLVIVPNCSWTGNECDLLVVTKNLRVIDVEIKISRADLKTDARKEKWFESEAWLPGRLYPPPRHPVNWPRRVWKHYYCVPRDIWADELYAAINPKSGVLFIKEDSEGRAFVTVARMAKPDRNADKVSVEDAVDIARLANLRMWDAYADLDRARDDHRRREKLMAAEPLSG